MTQFLATLVLFLYAVFAYNKAIAAKGKVLDMAAEIFLGVLLLIPLWAVWS